MRCVNYSIILIACLYAVLAFGQAPNIGDNNDIFDKRVYSLSKELRCLVCQNQTIADSHAEFSNDIRATIHHLIQQDYSDAAIKDFLVQRFGEFILMRPPFALKTLLLWLTPIGAIILGLIMLLYTHRKRSSPDIACDVEPAILTDDDNKKINDILHKS